ncbi:hypothetical protein CFS9_20690 [Flavobacterium sp. CFS9]|uniref:NUMOD3 motif-containing protein n=1 Tax=Flavobacterium sp. CFS9 TaxID=3143118 RepID=A0AAT9H1T4_9FLAO
MENFKLSDKLENKTNKNRASQDFRKWKKGRGIKAEKPTYSIREQIGFYFKMK